MGESELLPLDCEELGEEDLKKEKFNIKDSAVQILWKLKFIDKRIFIGLGFFVAVALVFLLTSFVSNNFAPTADNDDSDIFDPFANNNLGDAPLKDDIDNSNLIGEIADTNIEEAIEESKEAGSVSTSELAVGVRARLASGEILKLDMELDNHEILVDSVNGESIEVTIMSDPIFATLRLGIPKKFDLDNNGVYDLTIELLEIIENEGILVMQEIKESYDITSEEVNAELINTDEGLIPTIKETVPYLCVENDGFVEYSYIELLKIDGRVFNEKGFFKTLYDKCPTADSFTIYSCEDDRVLLTTNGDCISRREICLVGECVIGSYERNFKESGSPEEEYTGIDECHLVLDKTTFWGSISRTECLDLFIASEFLTVDEFIQLFESMGYDSSVLSLTLDRLSLLDISYSSSLGIVDDFSETEDKFVSDDCELLTYLGVDMYCFNYIFDKKGSNLDNFISLIMFSRNIDKSYAGNFGVSTPYSLLSGMTFVDGSGSSSYSSSYPVSGCSVGSKSASYDQGKIFVCDGLLDALTLNYNKASYLSTIYRAALDSFSGSYEKCYDSTAMIPCIKYNDMECDCCAGYSVLASAAYRTNCDLYNIRDDDYLCLAEDKDIAAAGLCFYCDIWEDCTRSIPYDSSCSSPVSYNYFDSLYGEYIYYLNSMADNDKISCTDRQIFYSLSSSEFDNFNCENGTAPGYSSPVYPSC